MNKTKELNKINLLLPVPKKIKIQNDRQLDNNQIAQSYFIKNKYMF